MRVSLLFHMIAMICEMGLALERTRALQGRESKTVLSVQVNGFVPKQGLHAWDGSRVGGAMKNGAPLKIFVSGIAVAVRGEPSFESQSVACQGRFVGHARERGFLALLDDLR
jgi:hypothetical protein